MKYDAKELVAFQGELETLGIDSDTLLLPPDQTLRAEEYRTMVTSRALRNLPELAVGEERDAEKTPDLLHLSVLGEGGMGIVRLANQLALDREVAVKTTRGEVSPAAAKILLQEAYVTGYLEHPNIVPIYNVGRTPGGAPLIVMKRIEGISWKQLVFDAPEGRELELKDHLEILLTVCDALRFAHSRGVIHRDIKLDNVMIGPFNEIYLLDWGIAVSLREDRPLLPRLEESAGLCGTPNYMAPEMARQEMDQQDERTDVYLLGATLHHLLTGQPRHRGERLLEVLFCADRSDPVDYGEGVPEELAAIVNRACARERQDRFPSVEAFQQAIAGHLAHRDSMALAEVAEGRVHDLETLLSGEEREPAAVHDLFGECRFAFQQALRMWPENQEARRGLARALSLMVVYHVSVENLEAAQAALAELEESSHAPEELQQEVQRLAAELETRDAELGRLQRMERAIDPGRTHRGRSLLALFLGIFWGISTLWSALRVYEEELTEMEQLTSLMHSGVRNIVIVLLVVIIFRRSLVTNRANAVLTLALVVTVACVTYLRFMAWRLGGDPVLAHITDPVLYALALFCTGLMLDRRISYMASFFAVAAVVGSFVPQ